MKVCNTVCTSLNLPVTMVTEVDDTIQKDANTEMLLLSLQQLIKLLNQKVINSNVDYILEMK